MEQRISNLRKKITPFKSLKYRDYRLFLTGFFISQMAARMIEITNAWQIYQVTHSAFSLGLIGIFQFLPVLGLSIFGGLTADKMERKKLLFVTQTAFGLCALTLGVFTFTHSISALVIYVVVSLIACVQSFYSPIRQSIIPTLVPKEDLMNAVSLNTLSRQTAIIVGPALAGFIIALYGPQTVYFISAFSFIFMLITIIPINIPEMEGRAASYSLKSILEGIRFVKSHRIISSTIMLDFFATFFSSATSLLPIFAADILKVDARGLGLLYSADSVGGVLAGLTISSLRNIKDQGKIIIGATLIYATATVLYGLSRLFWLSFLMLMFVGAGDMVSTILRNTTRQALTPEHLRGRMVGINILFAQGGPKLGDAEAGLLAALAGAPFSVVIGGVGTVIATIVIAWTHPKLRKYQGVDLEV